MKRILVINPGATSTKIAVYEDENEVMRVGITMLQKWTSTKRSLIRCRSVVTSS